MKVIIPPKGKSTGRPPKYIFPTELGESKLFNDEKVRQAATNYMRRYNAKNGTKIMLVCRKEKKGIRVHRVK